jgi:hypothetical protein
MSLATTVADAIKKVNELIDLVKGQYNKWAGEVKAQINKLESWKNNLIYTRYIKEMYLPNYSCGKHRLVKLGTIHGGSGAGFVFEAISGYGYNARVNQQRIVRMHVRFSNSSSYDRNISATMSVEGQAIGGFAHEDAIFIVNEDLSKEAKASNKWGVYVWIYGCTGVGRLFVKEAGGIFTIELDDVSGSLDDADIDIIKSHLPYQGNDNSFIYQPEKNLVLNGQTITA